MPEPSAILEPEQELTTADEDVIDRMMQAVLDAAIPQEFDAMVNAEPEFRRVLLKWRGHLTLAARAFYRMQKHAYASL